jgi:hypothetical protein
MQKKLLVAAIWCSSVLAQSTPTDVFQKAPPHIDEALRARIAQFLQAHVDGKFRIANELVADDSKDFYFAMEKHRYLSFDIAKIDYTDNFTKATVIATVEVNWRPSARFPAQRVKPPYKMLWKIENGEWFWYTIKTDKWDTPFGTMHFPNGPEQSDPAAQVIAQIKAMDGKAILNQIQTSKTDITLKSYEESSDSVEITNGMPGTVNLKVEAPPVTGLTIKIAGSTTLKQGEATKLTFDYTPPTKHAKPPATAIVRVEPLGHRLKFHLNFALPPEIEQQLPKLK